MFILKLILIICFILFGVTSNYLNSGNNKLNSSTLELVAILNRHGHRTPLSTYYNDPYKNESKYWPIGMGQLTKLGKQQLYILGKTLRERYNQFVPTYSAQAVRVNSSDADRCHMSAAALLAGMFPPDVDQIWNNDIIWQPIPIHSVPGYLDQILALDAPCPKYYIEKQKVDKEIFENDTLTDKKLLKYLTANMGEPIASNKKIDTYYSSLLIEKILGLEIPLWTKKVFPDKMRLHTAINEASWSWNGFLKKIRGGPMVKEILGQFYTKREGGNKNNKLFLYSAHDTTIVAVWRALGFTDYLVPDFGAALIFELHNSDSEYIVNIMYLKNATETEPYELDIPYCTSPCSLEKLLNVTEYVRSVDWSNDCTVS